MKKRSKFIFTKEAIELLSKKGIHTTSPTLIKWCRNHNLGKQFGGKRSVWYIDQEKLEQFIKDDGHDKKIEENHNSEIGY